MTDQPATTYTVADLMAHLACTRQGIEGRIRRRQRAGVWPGQIVKLGWGSPLQLTEAQVACLLKGLQRGQPRKHKENA